MSARSLLLLAALLLPSPAPAAPTAAPTPPPAAATAPAVDRWAPLRPLLGEWVGEPSGRPGEPLSSAAAFELQLKDGILVRRHVAQLPARAAGAPSTVHEDLLVIWPDGDGFRATSWDNEGHVIAYVVKATAEAVVFDTEPGAPRRFRLEYRFRPDGGQAITFSFARPGGELTPYTSGGAHRRAR